MSEKESISFRLILSPPASGPENMAIDEAILNAVSAGLAPPTLRFYAWDPACLSLGYAQAYNDVDLDRLERNGWDLVRRITGGRAILHADELTYSVAARTDGPSFAQGVIESYRYMSQGLLEGLRLLGLQPASQPKGDGPQPKNENPVCFEVPSPYEITVGGRKLIGSAQVRRRGALLQHGSLPLEGDIARICDVLHYSDQRERLAAAERVRQRACTVSQVLGSSRDWEHAADCIGQGFRTALGWRLVVGELLPSEWQEARSLADHIYSRPESLERT